MAAQGHAAVGYQADARPHDTSRSAHLRQCGAGENHIDQDELFDCHVNSDDSIVRVAWMKHLGYRSQEDFLLSSNSPKMPGLIVR
ncbi:hypothetical protein [Halomonas cupida]|uniref:hypothetical protein n=1 Tax=Halomonas cupida TaxID=44933 RepID=UPI003A8ECE6C